jgi:hypothetical protein
MCGGDPTPSLYICPPIIGINGAANSPNLTLYDGDQEIHFSFKYDAVQSTKIFINKETIIIMWSLDFWQLLLSNTVYF